MKNDGSAFNLRTGLIVWKYVQQDDNGEEYTLIDLRSRIDAVAAQPRRVKKTSLTFEIIY